MKIVGPFTQLLTMDKMPLRGRLTDEDLELIPEGGIAMEGGKIVDIGHFDALTTRYPDVEIERIDSPCVALPSWIDAHTHICFGGNRANDFAMRNAGKSYLEIAAAGGGIWSSVVHTRQASEQELEQGLLERVYALISQGVTTIEVKSGYGLDKENELKILRAIQRAQRRTSATLVPTCLAAHTVPKDFDGDSRAYLDMIVQELLPQVKKENLAKRVDIFIEKSAFGTEESRDFLQRVKSLGFSITVHADQFTPGSARIAVEAGAVSADHLEATSDEDIPFLAGSDTVAIALPGASIGLGEPFTPARKLLDAGAILAIATDWNPGSAPMGDLICQASILATFQKLSTAEVLAGITYRAAHALECTDRGILRAGKRADFVCYSTDNFQNILYKQGSLVPTGVYVSGEKVFCNSLKS